MPKFEVGIREVYVNTVVVEAETAEEAIKKAYEDQEPFSTNLDYSHTLGIEQCVAKEVPQNTVIQS